MAHKLYKPQRNDHGSGDKTLWMVQMRGLCNVPTIAMMREPALLGKKLSDLQYRFVGLNHFHWHKVTDKDGTDLTGRLIEYINDENGGTPVNIYAAPFLWSCCILCSCSLRVSPVLLYGKRNAGAQP